MAEAPRDQNHVTSILCESSTNPGVTVPVKGDQLTGRMFVDLPAGTGSTLTLESPTGTVDDSNVIFTVIHQPLYININGAQYTVGTGLYISYLAGTITLSSPVGTGGFIKSFYNA